MKRNIKNVKTDKILHKEIEVLSVMHGAGDDTLYVETPNKTLKFTPMEEYLVYDPEADVVPEPPAPEPVIEEPLEEPLEPSRVFHYEPTELEILMGELAATDYKAVKYAEGWYADEEYEPIRQEREELRRRIRALETQDA